MMRYLPVLDPVECRKVRDDIHALRRRWLDRSRGSLQQFFTLGAVTYIDVCSSDRPQADYYARAPGQNRLLRRNFGGLYEALKKTLKAAVGEPIQFASGLAMPGFHIFLGRAIEAASTATVHFDMQYMALRWKQKLDSVPPLSFTLPIALPRAGGGLDVWPITSEAYEEACARGIAGELDEFKDRKTHAFYEYRLGQLSVHSGLVLHRVGWVDGITEADERITLQGHAVRIGGVWQLHW